MKNYILPIIFLLFASPAFAQVQSGFLNCLVATSCNAPNVVVFKMHDISNSHAELPSQNNYAYDVCCGGIQNLANTCTGNSAVALRLSADTNAHAEEANQTTPNYDGHNVCLSVPNGLVTITYENNNCSGYGEVALASLATPPTNSHVGDTNAYPMKICAFVSPNLCSSITCGSSSISNPSAPSAPLPPPVVEAVLKTADFNHDGKVDILDLSILLYFADHPESPLYLTYDLNGDGKVDFSDVSILFYYWNVF